MDKDAYIEGLRRRYAEEIHSAYLSAEHSGEVDQDALYESLKLLKKKAKAEGLPENEFIDLVQTTLPDSLGSFDFAAAQ